MFKMSGFRSDFYEEVNQFGMRVSMQKDCECKAQRVLERRLKTQ